MSLILASSLLVGTALLLNAVFPARGRLANWLALACIVYGQVVLLSQILSELNALHLAGYLTGHALLFGLSLALWGWRGRPNLIAGWWISPSEVIRAVRAHPLLSLFAAVILLLSVANLIFGVLYPTLASDALNYHLPRAYIWSQTQTARHFPADDFRQVEFPPNASFSYLWMMVTAPQALRWLHLPQWVAGLVMAVGVAGLARLTGYSRAASVFGGLIVLTGTNTILQMSVSNSDLLTSAMTFGFIYFSFRFLMHAADGVPLARNHALGYAGLALGLSLGTKYTAFFLLPAAGPALMIYGFWRVRHAVWKLMIALGISMAIGFAIFGSYNYVLNLLNYGNPITTRDLDEASALAQDGPRSDLYGLGDNLIRYVYMSMDWALFDVTEDHPLFRQHWAGFSNLSAALGLNPESISEFGFHGVGLRQLALGTSGFGPVIYLALLFSPFVLIWCAWRLRRSPRLLVALLLLVMAWGWLATFSAIAPWSPYRTRYFNVFLPLVVAVLMPWLYRGRWRAFWLLPVMLLAAWTAIWAVTESFRRDVLIAETLQGQYDYDRAAGYRPDYAALLRDVLPADAVIGVTGEGMSFWSIVDQSPRHRYRIVPQDQIGVMLADGSVAGILSRIDTCQSAGLPYLTLSLTPQVNCLLLDADDAEIRVFFAHPAAVDFYGYQIAGPPEDEHLVLDPEGALVSEDDRLLRVEFPAQMLESTDFYIDVTYASGALTPELLGNTFCNGTRLEVELRETGLSLHVPPEAYDPLRLLQECAIFYDYYPELAIEQVRVYSAAVPPPTRQAVARFEDGTALLAVGAETQLSACSSLHLTTWWRVPAAAPALDMMVYLVDEHGLAQAEQRAPLRGIADDSILIARRLFPVPCETAPADYTLLFRVFPAGADQPLPVVYPADVQTLARLAAVRVTTAE